MPSQESHWRSILIAIQNLSVGFGARVLFSDATFNMNAGSRYGIVGANGSGKSTFLKVLSGEDEATTGSITFVKNSRLGVLEQDHFHLDEVPIIHVVMMGNAVLWKAMAEKEVILAAAAADPEAFDMERFGELEDIVVANDGYSLEAMAADILEGLKIPAAVHNEPLSVLSGGFKLRVLLAQVLASQPDVLLLDEPTNHLDIVSIAWLETFLLTFPGCVVTVSHDHHFLNSTCTHIIDVDYELLTMYSGNYDFFEKKKVENRERKEHEIAKQEVIIADAKKFIERFKAKASKAKQAQSKVKQVEKMEIAVMAKSSRRWPLFKFKAARDTGKIVLTVDKICKSFDEKQVLNDVSFKVHKGEKIAIIGPNGIGKSTMLKIAVGELEPDSGTTEWGHAVVPGYYSQDQTEVRSFPETQLMDWLWDLFPTRSNGFIRKKLAEVLFRNDEVEKRISALSGGEVARLAFSKISAEEPTTLILDEPTNHLDLESIHSLADGLSKYENAIIFVSHDRWFVNRLATRIIEISEDGVYDFLGSYDAFLAHRGSEHDHVGGN